MTAKLTSSLLFTLALGLSNQAHAQESSEAPAAEAQAEAESSSTSIPGWFRIDTDGLSTQLWVGATHQITEDLGLATDIYVVGAFAELDVGLAFSIGPVSLLPMIGIGFDFEQGKAVSLIAPQLFTIIDVSPLYFESWIQGFFNDPFDAGTDSLYTRNFLLYEVADGVAVGPQAELTYDLTGSDISSLPVGGRINLGYGDNNTLGLFLGYETQVNTGAVAGRFTFLRTW